MILKEIKILKKILKQYETEEKQIPLPMILEYGTLSLKQKSKGEQLLLSSNEETKEVDQLSKIYAFYIMP